MKHSAIGLVDVHNGTTPLPEDAVVPPPPSYATESEAREWDDYYRYCARGALFQALDRGRMSELQLGQELAKIALEAESLPRYGDDEEYYDETAPEVLMDLARIRDVDDRLGKSKKAQKLKILSSESSAINRLSTARIFLFGSRDIWFVVALPIFLDDELGWSYSGIGGFLAGWIIGYGIIQSWAPSLVSLLGRSKDTIQAARLWAFALVSVTVAIASFVSAEVSINFIVVGGLIVFGLIFAINSSIHSFLILAYSEDEDTVAINVGFYYAANALGRLFGTLLSGLTYLIGGLTVALWVSATCLFMNWCLSLSLPSTGKIIEDQ